ncbi:uncharacterized protein LOC105234162 isoform X6 [Bactrocera dorsalis]|uniref:Uncharacterized protein LOC105234162 isoform X6 n=1 Tax=Bactrocera dorsalis TaxID=27457 RepID=A0ABM3J2L9_BACDO|nr:uncharacterized protein LOC105234162 isoform X6 [Bactrocera dorsalis]
MSTIIEDEQMNNQRVLPRIVLIACGSFSPPTPMHFRMFDIARDFYKTQGTHHVIGGIVSPTHDSYQKKGLVAGTHRFAMLKLALQSSTWIKPSDWEIQQSEWSRTISVLQYHQNHMNNYINSPLDSDKNGTLPGWMPPGLRERQDGVQLKLLCGADLLESFAVPGLWADKDIEDIVGNHGLVVISRYGSNPEKFIFESDMLTKYQKHITLITNWVPNEVSSTIIRRLISRDQSVKYLLDDRVIDYIQMQGLFNCKTPTNIMSTIIEDEQMNNQRILPRIVLIACGSFSPPTPMHLSMFEIARDYFKTQGTHDVIGGIVSPTHDSYQKKGLVAGTHRFAMLKLALQSSTWIKPSDWEIQQSEWSRTISVLQYHQNYMNNYINSPLENNMNGTLPGWMPPGLRERQDGVQLKLLCGADLLESFAVPGLWADKDIEDIVGNHGLVVISRCGSNPEKFIFESDMLTKYQKHITLITNWVPNEMSSTLTRRLISRDQSVKYLLDDRVIDYIQMQGLFNCKTKYMIGLNRLTTYPQKYNNFYLNRVNTNPSSSVNNSPSDDEDDADEPVKAVHMDQSDYSIKNFLNSFNLDNRKPSSMNVFCCGGNENITAAKKLLPRRNGPGQVVQVVTSEKGTKVVTEIQRAGSGWDESEAKKKKTDAVNV